MGLGLAELPVIGMPEKDIEAYHDHYPSAVLVEEAREDELILLVTGEDGERIRLSVASTPQD